MLIGEKMMLTLQDKSNYLKGLLILIGKDKIITDEEKIHLLKISRILGFDQKFCEDAINELLENEYIIEEPPLFSNNEIAKAFIKDGIKLAFADKELHLYELNWLKSVSDRNNIEPGWGMKEFENFKVAPHTVEHNEPELEISKFIE